MKLALTSTNPLRLTLPNAVDPTAEILANAESAGPLTTRNQLLARASLQSGTMMSTIKQGEFTHAAMSAEALVETLGHALASDAQVKRDRCGTPLTRELTAAIEVSKSAANGLVRAYKSYADFYGVTTGSGRHSYLNFMADRSLASAGALAAEASKPIREMGRGESVFLKSIVHCILAPLRFNRVRAA